MYADTLPPAVVNPPPAYRSLLDAASAYTFGGENSSPPPIPDPSAPQLLPSHLAIRLAALPPAVVKLPPAYRSLPDTASAYTLLFIPKPTALQLLPFLLAMSLAA